MGLFGKLKRKVEDKAMSVLMAKFVKLLAEGRFGAGPAKLYWLLAGKKTLIAAGVAFAGGVIEVGERSGLCVALGLDCAGYGALLLQISAVLAAIGLYDGAIRTQPPVKPFMVR